jgi:hypothetical protein
VLRKNVKKRKAVPGVAIKARRGNGGIAPLILLPLDGGEWSVPRLGRFVPVERARGSRSIGGWSGPRTIMHVFGE